MVLVTDEVAADISHWVFVRPVASMIAQRYLALAISSAHAMPGIASKAAANANKPLTVALPKTIGAVVEHI